jgi:fibro-slime domain-containing protein
MHIASGSTGSHTVACALGAAVTLLVSCGNNAVPGDRSFPGSGGGQGQGGSGAGTGTAGGPTAGGNGQSGTTFVPPDANITPVEAASPWGDAELPPGTVFVQAEIGAWALGKEITGTGVANTGVTVTNQACNTIAGVVRDFMLGTSPGGHPDFEEFYGGKATPGLVEANIGPDGKPVYTGICEQNVVSAACPYKQQTTTRANFDQWYRFTEGVNKPYIIYLQFAPNGPKMTFLSHDYFPLDGAGWGNEGKTHNFAFTTEIHTKFKYGGGESFTFIGDDDVWVFINGKLAVDLGGLHTEYTGTIDLDTSAATLGIEKGTEYKLDLFHAERHTVLSNFRIDTNFAFTDCGSTIPSDVIK